MKTPLEHQRTGGAFIASRGKSLVGDTPGLGKTGTAITGLQLKGSVRPLVICPAVARSHWHREFADFGWDGVPPRIHSFDEIVRGEMPMMAELIHRALIDTVLVDEFMMVKHVTSQRAKLVAGNSGYIRRVPHAVALSGSIPRHAGEFFPILCALAPEMLAVHGIATREQFMARFTERIWLYARGEHREKVVGLKNEQELQLLLDAVMIRRTLDDVGLDVPKVWWQQWRLDGDELPLIDEMGRVETNAMVSEALRAGTLADIANEPHIARMRRRIGELKAPAVVRALTEQLDGTDERVVVFAHHRSVLDALRLGLMKFGVSYIDGDSNDTQRAGAIHRFQHGDNRIFLGQNIACRYSLTLTAARRVILVEPDWAADTNYQLGQRIARIGSTADRCIGQLVVLAGTLDEAITAQCERELRMADALFTR